MSKKERKKIKIHNESGTNRREGRWFFFLHLFTAGEAHFVIGPAQGDALFGKVHLKL